MIYTKVQRGKTPEPLQRELSDGEGDQGLCGCLGVDEG